MKFSISESVFCDGAKILQCFVYVFFQKFQESV